VEQLRRVKDSSEFEVETSKDEVLMYRKVLVEGKTAERPTDGENQSEIEFYEKQRHLDNLTIDREKLYITLGTGKKLIIPKSLRKHIFSLAHNHQLAGHLGLKRTKARIHENHFWYKSGEDISSWKSQCLTCAKHDVKRQASGVSKSTVPVKGIPLTQWSLDVLGPLKKSEKGNQYILVLSDLFTKWVELYALPDQKSEQIIQCLLDLTCQYSIPGSLLSDNGTNFTIDVTRCY
jgi:hypothetical protein